MRVFVGPMEVAGIGAGYVAGLRALGVPADLVTAYPHPFAYATDTAPPDWPPRLWAWAGRWRRRLPRGPRKALALALQHLAGWCVLAWALPRYDAFVFLYGETITHTALEGALLRRAGKRTVVVFVGSDARPPYIDGGWFPADRPFDAGAAARAAQRQAAKVQRLERQASVCVNAPATAHFHRRPFVHWFALGIPRPAVPAAPPAGAGRPVRVLHGPSHPALKGTARLREAVARLQARGVAIELVTIEGRPNAEVLQALRDCDLVVDQLYSDTPLAAFATEAAAAGRPVVVGSVAAAQVEAQLGPWPRPPSVYIEPAALEATLEQLAGDPARRAALGAAGAAFVAAHNAPEQVARQLLRLLRDDIPAGWWCDPAAVHHLPGCGLPEALARERVRAVLAHGGPAALQLDDKPALRQAFEAFAGGGAAVGGAGSDAGAVGSAGAGRPGAETAR